MGDTNAPLCFPVFCLSFSLFVQDANGYAVTSNLSGFALWLRVFCSAIARFPPVTRT